MHGPVANGKCVACHDAHGEPGSVRHVRRPLADVCLGCHDRERLPTQHCNLDAECDTCHEPHAASGPADLFLRARLPVEMAARSAFDPASKESLRGCGTPRPGETAPRALAPPAATPDEAPAGPTDEATDGPE